MHLFRVLPGLLFLLSSITTALAQTSTFQVDSAFANSPRFQQKTWPSRVTSGPSGKVYVSFSNGSFLSGVNGLRRGALMRFNPDGTLDTGFAVGTRFTQAWAVIEQSNGQVLVGGIDSNESIESGSELFRVFRLNADGTRDVSYRSPVFAGIPRYMTLQPDGKLLVSNQGGTANGGLSGLQRLNSDGSIDTAFSPPSIAGGLSVVFSNIVVDAAGKILIGGAFSSIAGQARPGIARLDANGALDTTFNPSGFALSGASMVRGIALQSSGKIVITGGLLRTTGSTANRPLLRLNPDGSLDPTFTLVQNSDTGVVTVLPRLLTALPDDKLMIVSGGLARFNADGSLDGTYSKPVFSSEAFWMDVLADGRAYVPLSAGSTINGASAVQQVTRFGADGTVDTTFSPGIFQREIYPENLAVQSNGQLLTWGPFDSVASSARVGAARFNADGTLDDSYVLSGPAGFLGIANADALSDGRIVASIMTGADPVFSFTTSMARFASSGAMDSTFSPDPVVGAAQLDEGFGLRALPDDKILVWSVTAKRVIDGTALFKRLNVDGTLDGTFTGFSGSAAQFGSVYRDSAGAISSITLGAFSILGRYPDGRLIAATTAGPYPQNAPSLTYTLVRFNSDGTKDSTFVAPSVTWPTTQSFTATVPQYPLYGLQSAPFSGVSPQTDGSVVVYGSFTTLGGQAAPGIARLTSTGAVDGTFSVGSGAELRNLPGRVAKVMDVATDADGKLWVSGLFDTFGGSSAPGLARLNADGSSDTGFTSSLSYQSYIGGRTRVIFDASGRPIVLGTYLPSADGFPDAIHRLVAQPVAANPTQPVAPPPTTQTVYTVPTGQMPTDAATTTATGTLGSATVTVTVNLSKVLAGGSFAGQGGFAAGYNIYVVALVPGGRLGLTSAAWFVLPASHVWAPLGTPIAAYKEGIADTATDQVVIPILESVDVTQLLDTEIYVGYGTSDSEMLQAKRYRGVYKVR